MPTSQANAFHIFQHFTTKFGNFTIFGTLFNAVVMNFTISIFKKFCLLGNWSIILYWYVNVLHQQTKFDCKKLKQIIAYIAEPFMIKMLNSEENCLMLRTFNTLPFPVLQRNSHKQTDRAHFSNAFPGIYL